jgi:hypothetical protein
MRRAAPLSHQELASINAIREACKSHPQLDVRKRGDQLESLLKPPPPSASSPGSGAIKNTRFSSEPLSTPRKEDETLRQTCMSAECSNKKETAGKMAKALFDLSLKTLQRICMDEFYLEMKKKTFGPPPNLTASIEQFNILSNFAAYEITKLDTQSPKARATIYKFFILLCDQLFKLKDFSSCMALLGGLNKGAVARLRGVMEHVDKKYMKMLEHLNEQMDFLKGVRHRMAGAEAESAPYIPYIGLFLTDLTLITENHKFDDPIINPDTPTKISAPLTAIAKAQLTLPYNLEAPKIIAYFESWTKVYYEWIQSKQDPEEILLQRSYRIEPQKASPRQP